MAKLFLLGFCLLCFWWDAMSGQARPRIPRPKTIVCNYCKLYRHGICLGGMKTCTVEKKKACRSQIFYEITDHGYEYSHTELDCLKDCNEKISPNDKQPSWTLCCQYDVCNLPYSYL